MMKVSDLKFCEIVFQSEAYKKALQLRNRLLRAPLQLSFDPNQLATEWRDYHLAVFDRAGNVLATLVLSPKPHQKIQMRQVAVHQSWHGQGIGKALVQYAEQFAREHGFELIFCHARSPVVPFYKKLGYATQGKPFEEVTIKHRYMEKNL